MMNKKHKKKLGRSKPPNFSGQHFMHNKKLVNEIVNRAHIKSNEVVMDLGAGKGALTMALNKKALRVLAVEYDGKLINSLKRKAMEEENIKVIHQDIRSIYLPNEPFVVVSNIPYAITTPIMKMLLGNPSSAFQRGCIVMEKGAAKRFTSAYVKDAYVLTWKMWFDIHYIKGISKVNFSPPPKVDAGLIKITRKKKPLIAYKHAKTFRGLAQYGMRYPNAPAESVLRNIFTAPQMKHLKRNLNLDEGATITSLNK